MLTTEINRQRNFEVWEADLAKRTEVELNINFQQLGDDLRELAEELAQELAEEYPDEPHEGNEAEGPADPGDRIFAPLVGDLVVHIELLADGQTQPSLTVFS